MNLIKLQQRLFAAARAQSPPDRVPFGFEQRIMANLKAAPAWDPWALWGEALWRAVAPCVAIMLLLGAWAWLEPGTNSISADLSQELEKTVLAAADQEPTTDSTW